MGKSKEIQYHGAVPPERPLVSSCWLHHPRSDRGEDITRGTNLLLSPSAVLRETIARQITSRPAATTPQVAPNTDSRRDLLLATLHPPLRAILGQKAELFRSPRQNAHLRLLEDEGNVHVAHPESPVVHSPAGLLHEDAGVRARPLRIVVREQLTDVGKAQSPCVETGARSLRIARPIGSRASDGRRRLCRGTSAARGWDGNSAGWLLSRSRARAGGTARTRWRRRFHGYSNG